MESSAFALSAHLRVGANRTLTFSAKTKSAIAVVTRDALRANRKTVVLLVDGRPFAPLTLYFRQRSLSLSAERRHARAVALLIDFISAYGGTFTEEHRRSELFVAFAHTMRYGSLQDQGDDPSGLWWLPLRMRYVGMLLSAATEFSDWLVENRAAAPLNPYRRSYAVEKIAYWRKWAKLREKALLGHLSDPSAAAFAAARTRNVAPPERTSEVVQVPPYFPHDRFDDVLLVGCRREGVAESEPIWERYNIRDMMIMILLHAGGLRISEPQHIYLSDVGEDPEDAANCVVRVYHPSDGAVQYVDPRTGREIEGDRAAFLRLCYGREPLPGWKGNLLNGNGKYMPVYWFPPRYGRMFLSLFKTYVYNVRPLVRHPYLFVTKDGAPMTCKSMTKRHAAAMRRIGMTPKKSSGTTPHGHRHSYGQLMQDAVDAGILSRKAFQTTMHHRSPLSQDAYNEREFLKINSWLRKAEEQMYPHPEARTDW